MLFVVVWFCGVLVLVKDCHCVEFIQNQKVAEKECHGTNIQFVLPGNHQFHYESLRRRYTGCTYVSGNLEITNVGDRDGPIDMSFLQSIRVVTGYVLIGLIENVDVLPLLNLELIRADDTVEFDGEQFGLAVVLTTDYDEIGKPRRGLKELQIPRLREISRGKVLFSMNAELCYVDSILWDAITSVQQIHVMYKAQAYNETCESCAEECGVSGKNRCWGKGRSMCQIVNMKSCHPKCNGRCYSPEDGGCCNSQCAVGCWGPRANDCELCRNYHYGNRCVNKCPDGTYPLGQICLTLPDKFLERKIVDIA